MHRESSMNPMQRLLLTLALLLALPAAAQQQNEWPAPPPQQAAVDDLRSYSPLIEAYVQETRPDAELGSAPRRDHYFLGKAMLAQGVVYSRMDKNTAGFWRRALGAVYLSGDCP